MAPVFPVRDLTAAMAHYELGFAARRCEGPDPYAFVERDGIDIHLAEVRDLKPRKNMSAVYLYVDAADALCAEWKDACIDGRLVERADTSYGLREDACLDRDANLIRFGSGIDRPGLGEAAI